jgi:hypothetical protein
MAALTGVLLAMILTLAGCQQPVVTAPVSVVSTVPAEADAILVDAAAALAARDYVAAREGYALALAAEPDNVTARYGLAVALSYLDRTADATAAFRWVAERGPRDGEEVRLARRWLAEGDSTAVTVASTGTVVRTDADSANGSGELQGQATWNDTGAPVVHGTLQILLEGSEPATRGRRYSVQGRLNEPYRVPGVIPGEYRLIGQVGMTRLWDRKVTIQPGVSTKLDLTDEISVVARPGAQREPGPAASGS